MKHLILTFAFLFTTSAFATNLIGTYFVQKEFNAHSPKRTQTAGLPIRPYVESIKIYREGNGAPVQVEVSYKLNTSSALTTLKETLRIVGKKKDMAVAQVTLLDVELENVGCGAYRAIALTLNFDVGFLGESVSNFKVEGVEKYSSDSCHSSNEVEKFEYSIDN